MKKVTNELFTYEVKINYMGTNTSPRPYSETKTGTIRIPADYDDESGKTGIENKGKVAYVKHELHDNEFIESVEVIALTKIETTIPA